MINLIILLWEETEGFTCQGDNGADQLVRTNDL